jgi:hypothetical protein
MKTTDDEIKVFLIARHESTLNNYYHFLTGYLTPIIDILLKNNNKNTTYIVRDCGLMNEWFLPLKKYYKIKILNIEKFLFKSSDSQNKIIFNNYDNPELFKTNNMDILLNEVKNFYKVINLKNEEKNIAILSREFAIKNISQFTQTSLKPRFIENIDELLSSINKLNNCNLIDTSTLNCQEVIDSYSKINFLIGQWGAGLTNMIWMPPKSTIIEITAKEKMTQGPWKDCYKNLALMLGHNFISIEAQETWSGPVDINKILELIKN